MSRYPSLRHRLSSRCSQTVRKIHKLSSAAFFTIKGGYVIIHTPDRCRLTAARDELPSTHPSWNHTEQCNRSNMKLCCLQITGVMSDDVDIAEGWNGGGRERIITPAFSSPPAAAEQFHNRTGVRVRLGFMLRRSPNLPAVSGKTFLTMEMRQIALSFF